MDKSELEVSKRQKTWNMDNPGKISKIKENLRQRKYYTFQLKEHRPLREILNSRMNKHRRNQDRTNRDGFQC